MNADRSVQHVPLPAVLMIVGAVLCFTMADAIIKFLTQRYPVPLLLWVRFGVQTIGTVLWFAPTMGTGVFRTRQLKLQVVRGVVMVFSSVCFYSALKWLPLADATAINYCTPVLVVLLSVAILKERMTRPRWAFVMAGFIGMLLIVRPGASILHEAALLALGGAGFYAAYQLLTRKLRGEDPRVTLFYPALCGTVMMTVALPWLDYRADIPWTHVGLICVVGAISTIAHFLFILAFQRAPASALTPFTYVQLVWAILAGWLIFGQFPDGFAFVGIGIIAASGLLLAWHERRRRLAASVVEEPTVVD